MSTDIEKKGIVEMKETYWQDVHHKVMDHEELKSEFPENAEYNYFETKKSRRSFLKIMGVSMTTLPLASCFKVPVKKALPYLRKDERSIPGVSRWYATTCQGCPSNCPLVVKNREGRPIKVEGNDLCIPTGGGCCVLAQGSLLGLYDSNRFRTPLIEGKQVSWAEADSDLSSRLKQSVSANKEIVIVSGETKSPSSLALIEEFKQQFGRVRHVTYSAVSNAALVDAHELVFGIKGVPQYDLSTADLVLSVGSDFLHTETAPIHMTRQYAKRKDLTVTNSPIKHIQVESVMTLTGSNADERIPLSAGEYETFILALLGELQSKAGVSYMPETPQSAGIDANQVKKIALQLWQSKTKSLVIAGSNNYKIQVATALINSILGNYQTTLHLENTPSVKHSSDAEIENLVSAMETGNVGAVVFWEVNPAYNYHNVDKFNKAVKQVPVRIAASLSPNETSSQCNYVLPTNHFFESWDDFYLGQGDLSISQPLIAPLRGSRMFQETLLSLMGRKGDYYSYIKGYWERNFHSRQKKHATFITFWEKSLHDGLAKIAYPGRIAQVKNNGQFAAVLNASTKPIAGLALQLYEKGHMRDGRWSSNPWLQELPDPVTKVTWDNYLMVSPQLARSQKLTTGDVVKLNAKELSIEVPILVQPGTAEKSLGLALGYGRKVVGKHGKGVGVNGFAFTGYNGKNRSYLADVSISSTGKKVEFALTQTHHSMEGRDIVRETTLNQHLDDKKTSDEHSVKLVSMWEGHKKEGHQWAMAIDLNKCTGCSSCVVSCNAENNIPVVGKEEVRKRREMHWLRLDRYYKGSDENPEVVHMPVMCQHCNNAPCETVCPVMATLQSSDGLNQQVYNRCIGTRYCANNCPYKVRRFNWFNYSHNDNVQNLVLNPDVVVRSRGVMEKCSMCTPRIQEAKLEMKKAGKKQLEDGAIKLACQQSCPADAIVFGDLNDKNSKISTLLGDKRSYHLLAELNVMPRVSYLTKVRNKD